MDADNEILYKEESFAVIGNCMKIHWLFGAGFLKAFCEEALEREFQELHIPFKRQVKLDLIYDNQKLKKNGIERTLFAMMLL